MSKILTIFGLMCQPSDVTANIMYSGCFYSAQTGQPTCEILCSVNDLTSGKPLKSWHARSDGNCYSADEPR